jgi:glycosyltransferase involved in cell wall biosynthesis
VPSLCYENSPAVIYEAFAAGLPAIGSKLGGIAELIGDDALLFAPKEDDIGRKMRFVMENRASLEKNRERNAELAESSSPSGYIDMILNL